MMVNDMKMRADGRYVKQIYIGTENNKKKYISVYGSTEAEVNEKCRIMKLDMGRGINVSEAKQTYRTWSEMFLQMEQKRLSNHIYSTKKNYITTFYDALGNQPLTEINPYQIEAVLFALLKENPYTHRPTSEKSLKEYLCACNQVFKFAEKNRAITFNPCTYVTVPQSSSTAKTRRALSIEERRQILSLECYGRLPAMLSLLTGMRRGEMAALTWNNVNLKNRTITVCQSYDYSNKILKSPKTENGYRVIPIPSILADVLANAPKSSIFVVSPNGNMCTANEWEKMLRDILAEMEERYGNGGIKIKVGNKYHTLITIEPFGWHDLRHTYATILMEADVDMFTRRDFLGHADIQTTNNIYTHMLDDHKRKSIEKIDEYLNSTSQIQVKTI